MAIADSRHVGWRPARPLQTKENDKRSLQVRAGAQLGLLCANICRLEVDDLV